MVFINHSDFAVGFELGDSCKSGAVQFDRILINLWLSLRQIEMTYEVVAQGGTNEDILEWRRAWTQALWQVRCWKESVWRQKSRVNWFRLGDINTAFVL
ncbi:hypothetical protein V6N11_034118 [Hibiscus sabdariffa]|uniref:Uncharacterized protein n=1 Tax=Hibiscus sabdariffa TaxID=183260 RepID=A0ABR2S1N7_9ROSI